MAMCCASALAFETRGAGNDNAARNFVVQNVSAQNVAVQNKFVKNVATQIIISKNVLALNTPQQDATLSLIHI